MNEIINDYQKFLEIAPVNDMVLITLFFFLAFFASITCFFLPLKYYYWYTRMERCHVLLQFLAISFFAVFGLKVYSSGNDPHEFFLLCLAGVNFAINWILYDKIIKNASRRLQVKIKGPTEIMSKMTEVKKEKERFGTNFIN